MDGGMRYLLDLPVYRLSEERYQAEMNAYIERSNAPIREMAARIDDEKKLAELQELENRFRPHAIKSYGGDWRYNEIFAYLRLHFLGTQVRAEYYRVNKKRLVRTRTKQLEFWHWKLAPETELPIHGSDDQIYAAILEHACDCARELKGRFVDMSALETLGPYVRWRDFFRGRNTIRP